MKAVITFGVVEGYFHTNETSMNEKSIVSAIQKCAELTEAETGIYCSGVLQNALTVYKAEWGCPNGGEVTYTYSISNNPTFAPNLEEWKNSVIKFTKELKAEFKQSTVTVDFVESTLLYLN